MTTITVRQDPNLLGGLGYLPDRSIIDVFDSGDVHINDDVWPYRLHKVAWVVAQAEEPYVDIDWDSVIRDKGWDLDQYIVFVPEDPSIPQCLCQPVCVTAWMDGSPFGFRRLWYADGTAVDAFTGTERITKKKEWDAVMDLIWELREIVERQSGPGRPPDRIDLDRAKSICRDYCQRHPGKRATQEHLHQLMDPYINLNSFREKLNKALYQVGIEWKEFRACE